MRLERRLNRPLPASDLWDGTGTSDNDRNESIRYNSRFHGGKDTPSATSAVVETVYRKPRTFADIHEYDKRSRVIDQVPTAIGFLSFDSMEDIKSRNSRYDVEEESLDSNVDLEWLVDQIPDMRYTPNVRGGHGNSSEREPSTDQVEEEAISDMSRYSTAIDDEANVSEDSDSCPAVWVNESQEDMRLHEKDYLEALEDAKRLKELNYGKIEQEVKLPSPIDSFQQPKASKRLHRRGVEVASRKKEEKEVVEETVKLDKKRKVKEQKTLETTALPRLSVTDVKERTTQETEALPRSAGWNRWKPYFRRVDKSLSTNETESKSLVIEFVSRSSTSVTAEATQDKQMKQSSSNEAKETGPGDEKATKTPTTIQTSSVDVEEVSRSVLEKASTSDIKHKMSDTKSRSSDTKSRLSGGTSRSEESRESLQQKCALDTDERQEERAVPLQESEAEVKSTKSGKSCGSIPTIQSGHISVKSRGRSVVTEPPAFKISCQNLDDTHSQGSPVKLTNSFAREILSKDRNPIKAPTDAKSEKSCGSIPTIQSRQISVNSRGRSVVTEPPVFEISHQKLDDTHSQGSPVKMRNSFAQEILSKHRTTIKAPMDTNSGKSDTNSRKSCDSIPTIQSGQISVKSRGRSVITEPPTFKSSHPKLNDTHSQGSPVKLRNSFAQEIIMELLSKPSTKEAESDQQKGCASSLVEVTIDPPKSSPTAILEERLSMNGRSDGRSRASKDESVKTEHVSGASLGQPVSNDDIIKAVRGEATVTEDQGVATKIDGFTSWIISGFDALTSIDLKAPFEFLDWKGVETQNRKIHGAAGNGSSERSIHVRDKEGALIDDEPLERFNSTGTDTYSSQTSSKPLEEIDETIPSPRSQYGDRTQTRSRTNENHKRNDATNAKKIQRGNRDPRLSSKPLVGKSGLVRQRIDTISSRQQERIKKGTHKLGTGVELRVADAMEHEIEMRNKEILERQSRKLLRDNVSISSIEIPTLAYAKTEDEYSVSILGLKKSTREQTTEDQPLAKQEMGHEMGKLPTHSHLKKNLFMQKNAQSEKAQRSQRGRADEAEQRGASKNPKRRNDSQSPHRTKTKGKPTSANKKAKDKQIHTKTKGIQDKLRNRIGKKTFMMFGHKKL